MNLEMEILKERDKSLKIYFSANYQFVEKIKERYKGYKELVQIKNRGIGSTMNE